MMRQRRLNKKRAKIQKQRRRQMEEDRRPRRKVTKLERRKKKKMLKILKVLLIIILSAASFSAIIYFGFQVKNVTVTDNEQYTETEITEAIFGGGRNNNTFIFWIRSKIPLFKEDISFLDDYDVKMVSPSKIKLLVYEKSLVGYIQCTDSLMYFDKDGVVEKSTEKAMKGIPMVTGIECDELKLYEKIPVKNDEVFKLLLNVSQAIEKYDFKVKKINISDKLETTLYIKDVEVQLGKENDLNAKLIDLKDMIDGDLLKYSGTLNMKNLSKEGNGYTLKRAEKSKKQ